MKVLSIAKRPQTFLKTLNKHPTFTNFNQLRNINGIIYPKLFNNPSILSNKSTNLHNIPKYFCTNENNKTPEKKSSTTEDTKTDSIQTTEQTGALSTFVKIKERTEEGISLIYIFGVLFCAIPYCFYLVIKTQFSSSGPDKIKNKSFDILKDDPRIMRILGNDVRSRSVSHHATFTDNDGNERMQVIYEIEGSKGEARVDVEMLKEKEWNMQYVIVSTQFASIPIVDNRSVFA